MALFLDSTPGRVKLKVCCDRHSSCSSTPVLKTQSDSIHFLGSAFFNGCYFLDLHGKDPDRSGLKKSPLRQIEPRLAVKENIYAGQPNLFNRHWNYSALRNTYPLQSE